MKDNIRQQIKKHEEAIEKLKAQLEEQNTLKIPELNIEITFLKEWTKPYNEIEVPKGWRLVKLSEYLFIWENEKYRNIYFADYLKNPDWIRIWCEQLWNDKKNNWSRRLSLYKNLVLVSDWDWLDGSSVDGRVAYCRELKK